MYSILKLWIFNLAILRAVLLSLKIFRALLSFTSWCNEIHRLTMDEKILLTNAIFQGQQEQGLVPILRGWVPWQTHPSRFNQSRSHITGQGKRTDHFSCYHSWADIEDVSKRMVLDSPVAQTYCHRFCVSASAILFTNKLFEKQRTEKRPSEQSAWKNRKLLSIKEPSSPVTLPSVKFWL